MASVLPDPKQKRASMDPIPLQPKPKKAFMPRFNRGQKRCLLASPQYASVLKPKQNHENNRDQKPSLH